VSKAGTSRRLAALACLTWASAAYAGDPLGIVQQPAQEPLALDLTQFALESLEPPAPLNLTLRFGAVPALRRPRHHRGAAVLLSVPLEPDALALNHGVATFNLSGPQASNLASGAVLNLDLPAGAVKAEATASIGKEVGQTTFWHKDAAKLTAALTGPMGTALAVSGENRLSLSYRAPESVGASDRAAHVVRTETQTANIALSVPAEPISVTLGGDTTSNFTQEGAPGDSASFAKSAVRTADHNSFVSAEWSPFGWLKLEGGTAVRLSTIALQNDQVSTYRTNSPHLALTLTPWRLTQVSARLEQKVASYDVGAFANYAHAAPSLDASHFQPDHAWQLETHVEQRVGPASLSATYTLSRQGTATEFAEVSGQQAPTSTPLLDRDSLAISMTLPLSGFGLPHTDLTSQARWQSSRVIDPVTQAARTASGEPAQSVSLRLSHHLPARRLSIGVTGEFTGTRTAYQVNQTSQTADGTSLGAFVTYQPGTYEVELNVNGLTGGATRSEFYRGLRGASLIDHTALQDNTSATLRLSLKRAF
jgi:hypothetical protein